MDSTEKTVSALVSGQLPEFIRADHPKFKRFLELYYTWLEQNNPEGVSNTAGNTIYHAMNIGDYRDIDQTPDEFITFFKSELLPYFPETTALDLRKILKSAREFYSKKGSEESVKWLFKALFGEDIEIFYPKEQILKTSDGKWKKPKAFRITVGETNKNVDVNLLEKKLVVGSESGATCVIESANRTLDTDTGKEIIEIYISNIKKYFNNGEYIIVNYTDADGVARVFKEKIIGTISNIYVDSNIKTDPQQKRRGLSYNVGDPVVIVGGLAQTAEAVHARAIVGNVTLGSIEAVTTVFPGYGYREYSNTEVVVISHTGDDPNANANTDLRVLVTNLTSNTSNSNKNFIESITYDKTVIDYLSEVEIGNANLAFFTVNNFNTLLSVTENDQLDHFNNHEQVWANGNNYFDALFTAKIATPNGNTKIYGTVNVSSTSNVVTGVDTAFDVELKVGQKLEVAGTRRTIDAITNNDYLTTSTAYPSTLTAQTAYRIGNFGAQGGIGTEYTGGLLLYDVANTGTLSVILNGAQLNTKNTHKTFMFNAITTPRVNANSDSALVQCLKFVTVNTGGISLISVVDGGAGFRSDPELLIKSEYDTMFTESYPYKNTVKTNNIQTFKDLGLIAHVYIVEGGSGYANGDTITFSGRGYGGSANVVVGANGTIKSINLIDRGEGHLVRPTCTINTSGGTGAVLTAFLFGDGYDYKVETSAIGRVKDIRLLYRGYDYISTPNVSLKVIDTVINPIAENEKFTEEEYVYQGTSLSTSTFRANVASFDRATNLLRLYNYSGQFSNTANIISANGVYCTSNLSKNVAAPAQYLSTVIATGLPNPMIYGNGRARAKALFANGLIEFNGFFINSDGFVSADKVLQDGRIYHNFSYVIQSNKNLADYKNAIKGISHPSGMKLISKRIVSSEYDTSTKVFPSVDYIKPRPGEIQVTNSYSNVVTGSGTSFNTAPSKINVGDLFIVSDTDNDLRSISKIVSKVNSDTELEIYGDFTYIGQGKATTNNGNTWLRISGAANAITDFIQDGDQIRMNLISVIVSGTVNVSASSTTVTGNTTGSNTTHFLGNVVTGSQITVNNETRIVTTVTNDNTLVVNSAFTHAATDKYMVANSVIVKTVSSVSGNVLIMNTAYFTTKTNLVYQVVPDYSGPYNYNVVTMTAN